MIKFLLRTLGLFGLAAAFVLVIYDGTKSIAGSAFVYTPLGQIWTNIHSKSLQLFEAGVSRHVSQVVWDSVVLNVLTAPAWLVFAILGAILMVIGRKKRPLIGYARD